MSLTNLSQESKDTYVYEALDPQKPAIRLLRILPPKPNGDLCVALTVTPFNDQIVNEYIALSYRWGDDEPDTRVWIGDQYIMLRKNICGFISSACDKSQPGLAQRMTFKYWIDAICINQNDNGEKNSQVAMMGKIYSYAAYVFAWLGTQPDAEKAQDDEPLFNVGTVYNTWIDTDALAAEKNLAQQFSRIVDTFDEKLCEINGVEKCEAIRRSLRNIFRDPYWERLWIVQELCQARELMLMWHNVALEPRILMSLHNVLQSQHTPLLTGEADNLVRKRFESGDFRCDVPDILRAQVLAMLDETGDEPLMDLIAWRGVGSGFPLDRLLSRCHSKKCKDPHDKIYALIGMSGAAQSFIIDYDCDIRDLGKQTLRYLRREHERSMLPFPEIWRSELDISHLQQALGLSLYDLEDDNDTALGADALDAGIKTMSKEEVDADLEAMQKKWQAVTGLDPGARAINLDEWDKTLYNDAVAHAQEGRFEMALHATERALSYAIKLSGSDGETAADCRQLQTRIKQARWEASYDTCVKFYESGLEMIAQGLSEEAVKTLTQAQMALPDALELVEVNHEVVELCTNLRAEMVADRKAPLDCVARKLYNNGLRLAQQGMLNASYVSCSESIAAAEKAHGPGGGTSDLARTLRAEVSAIMVECMVDAELAESVSAEAEGLVLAKEQSPEMEGSAETEAVQAEKSHSIDLKASASEGQKEAEG